MTTPNGLKKLGGFGAWVIWGVASLFYLYEYFLRVAPSVMVHPLMLHFQISAGALGALAAFYYYAYSPMQVVVGLMLDRWGGKKILPGAVFFCAIGSLAFAMTENYWIAATGRLMMGTGSAFAFVGALYVTTNWFPEKNFAMLSGATTTLGMLGAFLGQGPTAFLVHHTGWQMAWFGAAGFGVFLGILLLLLIPARPSWAQAKSKNTVLQNFFRVLKNGQTWIIGLYGGLIYVPTSTFAALWGVPFIMVKYRIPRVQAATMVSMIFLGWIFGSPAAGWLSDRWKRRKPLMVGSSIGVLVLSVAVLYGPNLSQPLLYGLMMLIGLCSGGQVVCFAAAFESNPLPAKGSALAVTNMLVMSTAALLQPLVGWLLDEHNPGADIPGIDHFTAGDFHFALIVVPISLVLALVFALLTRETHAHQPGD